jgi:hypothetical protein
MTFYPVFLSVVFIVRNHGEKIEEMLLDAEMKISPYVADYELVIIDNASQDDSTKILKKLTSSDGIPNLQVYALTNEVSSSVAACVGLENALGDFVAIVDPLADDVAFLLTMLDKAVSGVDVVFATNTEKTRQSISYRMVYGVFVKLYRIFAATDLAKAAPSFRLLSKRIINFILQHPQPSVTYRHLPATRGFAKVSLQYTAHHRTNRGQKFSESIEHGMQLLVSTTKVPMRLVTSVSLFGAAANLVYSIYVLAVGLFKTNIAPGWVSLSLQQSGMFFLISLVLVVLGEYILQMARLSIEGPSYHIAQEYTSARINRAEKLNIEEAFK